MKNGENGGKSHFCPFLANFGGGGSIFCFYLDGETQKILLKYDFFGFGEFR